VTRELSRRSVLGLLGAGAVGAAAASGTALVGSRATSGAAHPSHSAITFHGAHQAGITTDVQDRLHFATFDVTTRDRSALVNLLRTWTEAAARMTTGAEVGGGATGGAAEAPPDDTGEALELPPSRLTLTVGFGPTLFDERFGLADARPPALVDLPRFRGETLDPARCGGDLAVQACADDPQVAVHAIRNLARLAFGTAAVRWSQLGFGRTSTTSRKEGTPRNLFGFKDGTANIVGSDTARADEQVWVGTGDGPAWMTGGSYLVARRIRMLIETWDRAPLNEQENIIGRDKREGAPLGQSREFDDFDPEDLPENSHVRLSHPANNGGAELLRRGYSFTDGSDGLGHLDAGLFFLAYQRDPRRQFIPIQERLARSDTLNEYIRHTGSGIWACPPGVQPGGFWGDTLFG
jgi:deferrochelatase/peroxidase EfeB